MGYKLKSLRRYLDDLSAKLPAPGGGSAAALTAACGASLISMVVNFTLGKPRYARYEGELKRILFKSEKLRKEFLGLLDADVAAYKSKNLRKALDVPLKVCRLCLEGIKLCPLLVKKSNPALSSDLAAAAVLLDSAFACDYFNVEVNLKFLGDKKLTQSIKKELAGKRRLIKKISKSFA